MNKLTALALLISSAIFFIVVILLIQQSNSSNIAVLLYEEVRSMNNSIQQTCEYYANKNSKTFHRNLVGYVNEFINLMTPSHPGYNAYGLPATFGNAAERFDCNNSSGTVADVRPLNDLWQNLPTFSIGVFKFTELFYDVTPTILTDKYDFDADIAVGKIEK